jgi:hypothetical protein
MSVKNKILPKITITNLTDNFTQLKKIQASDRPGWYAQFGTAADVSANHIIVGAFQDPSYLSKGAAYLFGIDGGQIGKLVPSDSAQNDRFSTQNNNGVAVTKRRVYVGTSDKDSGKGAVYFFDLTGTQLMKLQPSDLANYDGFGMSMAATESRLVVGAPQQTITNSYEGSAYIFDIDGNQLGKIVASDPQNSKQFGRSIALSDTRIVVGGRRDNVKGTDAGAAYVFDIHGTQLAKLYAPDAQSYDYFGYSIAVSDTRIVVGTNWNVHDEGDPVNHPHNNLKGAAYVFDKDGTFIKKLQPSDLSAADSEGNGGSEFGYSVACSDSRIVVSCKDGSSVYIFNNNGDQLAKIISSDHSSGDNFGRGLAVSDTNIVVGSPQNDTAGSAYIFKNFYNHIPNINFDKLRRHFTGKI